MKISLKKDLTIKKANWKKHTLNYRISSKIKNQIQNTRTTYYLILEDSENNVGIGEAAPMLRLTMDSPEEVEVKLENLTKELIGISFNSINDLKERFRLEHFATVLLALEMALLDLANGGRRIFFGTNSNPIITVPNHGLVWEGNKDYMYKSMQELVQAGFNLLQVKFLSDTLSLKDEIDLLTLFSKESETSFGIKPSYRLAINGRENDFDIVEAGLTKLKESGILIDCISQPFPKNMYKEIRKLKKFDFKIALDDELRNFCNDSQTRIRTRAEKEHLLDVAEPDAIIIRPLFMGGFSESLEWIELANKRNISWWLHSFLESNLTLSAYCQFWYEFSNHKTIQALGTGKVFEETLDFNLETKDGNLILNLTKQ